MPNFYFIHADGSLACSGHCSDDQLEHQAIDGLTLVLGDVPQALICPSRQHDWIDGAWVLNAARKAAVDAVAYKAKRAAEYPKIGDQLDVLFKAMGAGTLPMIHEFYDPIVAVKAKYPKPTLASEP